MTATREKITVPEDSQMNVMLRSALDADDYMIVNNSSTLNMEWWAKVVSIEEVKDGNITYLLEI